MEPVAEVDGVLYVNDTAATAPAPAIATLRAAYVMPTKRLCLALVQRSASKAGILQQIAAIAAHALSLIHISEPTRPY